MFLKTCSVKATFMPDSIVVVPYFCSDLTRGSFMGVVTVSRGVFGGITVSFPYDPQLVAKAKAIEGHKWHPAEK